jgi:hypothetical protein
METIKMGKKYQTRDGRAVRILCADLKGFGCAAVIGLVTQPSGTEYVETWMADGGILPGASPECIRCSSLIPVPTKHEAWMPVSYDRDGAYWVNGRLFDSQEEVGITMGRTRIAHVTWED